MISKHLFCILVFFINLNCIPASETYKSIMWDPENPSFIVGNSDCPYKYKHLKIRSASKIQFICPNVATVLRTTSEEVSKTNKFENLWLLYNKDSFDKCDTTLDENVTQPALRCNEPTQLQFHSITFQRFAATPGEPEFKKGHSYYIIATSDGKSSNINATSGGHCNDTGKNVSMKIEVYVCNETDQVEDEMCKNGVGELTCPGDTSSSSSCPGDTSSSSSLSTPTPTPSTPHVTMSSTPFETTATQIPTPTTVATTSTNSAIATKEPHETTLETTVREGKLRAQKGDSNGDSETVWMVTACIFMVLSVAIVIAMIWYIFFFGKKKGCQYEPRKVTPDHQYGSKNPAFKHDHEGFAESETGSQIPDKEGGVVIYNKEVFYNKDDGGENDKKNLPV
ncbi:uncharacterized protein LOC110044041 [Orbicella faveolata]|uniref:uncharacterized protein LOC110044041 n=1 Tax=Orbicella faveolata TaxID=48498 RepID=UPI0009E3EB86|nr:uncharacterized protein LOC110044041 [Orbicella faveolata]